MKKGDIILLPFPFTDLSGSKTRPALVLISNSLDSINELKSNSLARLSKLATIDSGLVLEKLREISKNELGKLNKKLIITLQIKV